MNFYVLIYVFCRLSNTYSLLFAILQEQQYVI